MAKRALATAAALATTASLTEAIVKAPAQTTVGGYQITLTAFIPVAPDDLKKQAEIPTILLAIQEGEKTFADLSGHLKQVEFRAPFTRKRMPEAEAKALLGIIDAPLLDGIDDGQSKPEEPLDPDFDEVGKDHDPETGGVKDDDIDQDDLQDDPYA